MWTLRFDRFLGRGTHGKCTAPDEKCRTVTLLNRLRGEELLDTLVHEVLHAADWHKDEGWVEEVAGTIARLAFRPGMKERIWPEPPQG